MPSPFHLRRIHGDMPFPPVSNALSSPNGLLAVGGDLSVSRLLDAYRQGIFPWFSSDDPILWWSPDPRMVLFPDEFKLSKSLGKVLRNGNFEVRCDTVFETVMRACATPRPDQNGTWIQEDMISAYVELHRLGYAHSIETWQGDQLVGGLYGVSIGRMFYGESMFSRTSNASKVALAHLAKQLQRWGTGAHPDATGEPNSARRPMIDCQMNTPHLASLGAREIRRTEFVTRLQDLVNCAPIARWQFDSDLYA